MDAENFTIFLPIIKIVIIVVLAFLGFKIFRHFVKKSISKYVDKINPVRNYAEEFIQSTTSVLKQNSISNGIKRNENNEFIQKRKEAFYDLVFKATKMAIIFFAVVLILYELGILKTAPFAAILGFLGIAVGIGIQNLVRDVLRGFFIITENNLKKGDAVNINGFEGKIYDINFRRVILELSDEKGRFCYIPIGEVDAIITERKNY